MKKLDELYTDEMLDSIGNVLVLSDPHDLKLAEIKRLTRADKVRKLKYKMDKSLDDYVMQLMTGYLTIKEIDHRYDHSVYIVSGEKVSSTMLAMRTEKFRVAVRLDSRNVKKLHNTCVALWRVKESSTAMHLALEAHEEALATLDKIKVENRFEQKTDDFRAVADGYGEQERVELNQMIDEYMSRRW